MSINLKKYGALLLLLTIFLLSAGVTCASQNLSDNVMTIDSDEIHIEDHPDNTNDDIITQSQNNTDGEILSMKSDDMEDNLETSKSGAYSEKANSQHFSTNIEYEPLTKLYTPITKYHVNVYDVYKSGQTQTKKPIKAQLKLIVNTGNSNKTYTQKSNENGQASFTIPNLAVGIHKVYIYVDGEKRAETTIKINSTQTKVTAPATYVKYPKNNKFRMKVLDTKGNPIKNVLLKVNVYTGKKYKTYTIKTSNYGNAYIQTKTLTIGVHKVIISSENKNYQISKTTKIIVKKANYNKINLSFDSIKVMHKKNNYFTVKATNVFGDSVRNVAVKLFVFTGHSHKTYTVKTNKQGFAKIQTKGLSIGTHKIKIIARNVKKNANILVVDKITAPKLVSLYFSKNAHGEYCVKLKFNSQKFGKYQILKKSSNSFRTCAVVKATSKTTLFNEKVSENSHYSYSVREIISSPGGKNIYGPYDKQGLKMLTKPKVSVEFQNIRANIKWNKVAGASKYIIYRKIGTNGTFKSIATVNGNKLTYSDTYSKSATQLSSIFIKNKYLDPSFNNLIYTVRACANEGSKVSYGLYDSDGVFHLEPTTIVSLKSNQITWANVANAEGYLILEKVSGVWKEIARINAKKTFLISYSFNVSKNSYYSVQAYAHDNGQIVYSNFDEGLSLVNYNDSNENRILYFGDSITYGSPYRSESLRHIFSFPYRVAQLIGGVYYNPSIPGATYHDLGVTPDGKIIEEGPGHRCRITRDSVDKVYDGKLPSKWKKWDIDKNSAGETKTRIADYNIIVLSAGTNDYTESTKLGDISGNDTTTFHGALNHILEKIELASKERVEKGKDSIKVVFVDLFYGKINFNNIMSSRDTSPNSIGLTLMDYQDALNAQQAKWSKSTYLTTYTFKTRDYNFINDNNSPYATADNTHPIRFKYSQYGNAFAKFLLEEVF